MNVEWKVLATKSEKARKPSLLIQMEDQTWEFSSRLFLGRKVMCLTVCQVYEDNWRKKMQRKKGSRWSSRMQEARDAHSNGVQKSNPLDLCISFVGQNKTAWFQKWDDEWAKFKDFGHPLQKHFGDSKPEVSISTIGTKIDKVMMTWKLWKPFAATTTPRIRATE